MGTIGKIVKKLIPGQIFKALKWILNASGELHIFGGRGPIVLIGTEPTAHMCFLDEKNIFLPKSLFPMLLSWNIKYACQQFASTNLVISCIIHQPFWIIYYAVNIKHKKVLFYDDEINSKFNQSIKTPFQIIFSIGTPV